MKLYVYQIHINYDNSKYNASLWKIPNHLIFNNPFFTHAIYSFQNVSTSIHLFWFQFLFSNFSFYKTAISLHKQHLKRGQQTIVFIYLTLQKLKWLLGLNYLLLCYFTWHKVLRHHSQVWRGSNICLENM